MLLKNRPTCYFYTALILPKIKFKLSLFFKRKMKKSSQIFSFWKSFSWFSHEISSFTKIRISTFKKFRNKVLLRNFITNLLQTANWISFSEIDIINKSERNYFTIKKNYAKLLENTKLNFNIITTNKVFNKIFKNFISIILTRNNNKNSTFFMEKYFIKEKYTRALGISNTLKFLVIKFFSFYTNSTNLIKKLFFTTKTNLNEINLYKLINYLYLFIGKRYFIFFDKNITKAKFSDLLTWFFQSTILVDSLIFIEGVLYSKTDYLSYNTIFLIDKTKNSDNTFVNFFLSISWQNFIGFELLALGKKTNPKKMKAFLHYYFNFTHVIDVELKFLLLITLQKILWIFLTTKLFNIKFLYVIFYKKCQLLVN